MFFFIIYFHSCIQHINPNKKCSKCVLIYLRLDVLYRGKEQIHSETVVIIYLLKWYSSTKIITLSL